MVDDTTTLCKNEHRYSSDFESLPDDQGGAGRHKCAGCAYDRGFADGLARKEQLDLGLEFLPESQAGTVVHKSPHAAYAAGYLDGVRKSYED
jgi:hypothetical protein